MSCQDKYRTGPRARKSCTYPAKEEYGYVYCGVHGRLHDPPPSYYNAMSNSEWEEFEEQLMQDTKEFQAMRSQLACANEKYESEKKISLNLRSELSQANGKIVHYEKEKDSLKVKLEALEKENNARKNQVTSSQLQLNDLRVEFSYKNQLVSDLRSEIADKNQLVSDLRSEIADKNQLVSDLRSEIADKNQLVSDLRSEIDQRKSFSKLEREIHERYNNSLEQSVKSLKLQLKEKCLEKEMAMRYIEQENEAKEQLEKEYEHLQGKYDANLNQELKSLQRQLKDAAKLKELKNELQALRERQYDASTKTLEESWTVTIIKVVQLVIAFLFIVMVASGEEEKGIPLLEGHQKYQESLS
eukprot:Nk52_evm44s163 gene=Nk52_evmTU44s163